MRVFLIALFVCVATITNAQTKKFNWYSTESLNAIDATPEQHKQVKELVDLYKTKTTEVNNNTSLSADEKKAKIKALQTERSGLYYKILTKEQKKKGNALRNAQRK